MANLFVPVVENNIGNLYSVECGNYQFPPFLKRKIKLLAKNTNEKAEKDFSDKLEFALSKIDSSFSITLNRLSDKSLFSDYTSSVESVTLGLYCSAYAFLNHRTFKSKYDSITVTGNIEVIDGKVNLLPVKDIEEKFYAVKEYASEHNKTKHLFIYVSDEEVSFVEEGLHENNVVVLRFSSSDSINLIRAEIFEPDFSDEQRREVEKLYIKNEYIPSKVFLNWKKEITKNDCGGFLICGKSNTGKSAIAKELSKYLLETKIIDDIVWISINDNSYFWDLLQKESKNRLMPLNQAESVIKKSYVQEFDKLDSVIDQDRKVILIFDNIEYSFVDDILDFLSRNYSFAKNNIKLIITSWEECKYKENLEKFSLVEKKSTDINFSRQEFESIILSVINSLFYKSKYYDADEKTQKQLLDLLCEQCKDDETFLPGFIVPALSPLERNDIEELIDIYKEQDIKCLYSKVKILKIQFEVIDLFAQIVLFAFLTIKDFEKPLNADKIIEIINSKLFASDFKDKPILTLRNVKTAIKELEQASLLQRIGPDKYYIKNDSIKYCVFSKKENNEISEELARVRDTIIPVEKKIEYAIENNLYKEFEKFITVFDDKKIINDFLIKACEYNCNELFFYKLFDKKIDVCYKDKDGHSAFDVYCCFGKSAKVLDFLVKRGFIISNNETGNGTDSLLLAINNGSYEIIEYLLANKIITDFQKQYFNSFNLLQLYTLIGINPAIFDLLIKYGADKEEKTKSGFTLLQCASLNSDSNILKHMLEINLFPYIDELSEQGATALQLVCGCGNNSNNIDLLLKYGADSNILSPQKQTILHLAAMNSESRILKYLLDNGFGKYMNTQNINNQTPLELAMDLEKDMKLSNNVKLLKEYNWR